MQIDRYNHLQFPREANTGNNPAATGKDAAPSAAGVLVKPPSGSAVPAAAVARATGRLESVVLNIQWPDVDVANSPDPGVYTNGRKTTTSDRVDTDAMAREHQLAVDRNAGIVTQIAVNKDGVLVARPHPAAPEKQPDFVALAVSAMREYRDDPERQRLNTAQQAPAPDTHWTALKGLQQIAAKLNVFA